MIPETPVPSSVSDPDRFKMAIQKFDEENARDPNLETSENLSMPRELLYARRLTDWVLKLSTTPSEELLLAARSQHLCRWTIPRQSYPMNRTGYLRWRNDLKKFHARKAGEILSTVGYPQPVIDKVQSLNLKSNFPQDPESRILEDALCLVFLQFQFAELAAKTDEDKMINALRKSWGKMTSEAREQALKLPYSAEQKRLLDKALQR